MNYVSAGTGKDLSIKETPVDQEGQVPINRQSSSAITPLRCPSMRRPLVFRSLPGNLPRWLRIATVPSSFWICQTPRVFDAGERFDGASGGLGWVVLYPLLLRESEETLVVCSCEHDSGFWVRATGLYYVSCRHEPLGGLAGSTSNP